MLFVTIFTTVHGFFVIKEAYLKLNFYDRRDTLV